MPDFKAKMLTALPQTPSWILWGPTSMGREGEEGKEGKGSPPPNIFPSRSAPMRYRAQNQFEWSCNSMGR